MRRRRISERARAIGSALLARAMTSSRQSLPKAARVHIARAVWATGPTTGPRSATAKSSRGSTVMPWFRSLRSSMTLMPPTKARSASQASSLWCRRRSWPGCSHAYQRSSGRKTASATPLPSNQRRSVGRLTSEPKPSTTTRTRTPRRAAAISVSAMRRAASSWWKM
jgi:hypothetical protein